MVKAISFKKDQKSTSFFLIQGILQTEAYVYDHNFTLLWYQEENSTTFRNVVEGDKSLSYLKGS